MGFEFPLTIALPGNCTYLSSTPVISTGQKFGNPFGTWFAGEFKRSLLTLPASASPLKAGHSYVATSGSNSMDCPISEKSLLFVLCATCRRRNHAAG